MEVLIKELASPVDLTDPQPCLNNISTADKRGDQYAKGYNSTDEKRSLSRPCSNETPVTLIQSLSTIWTYVEKENQAFWVFCK
jgi:hypothetical protein